MICATSNGVQRHHELVTDTSMNNVSNVAFTYTHVVDTPMNDGANFSFNDINKHSPEEEWGDMIGVSQYRHTCFNVDIPVFYFMFQVIQIDEFLGDQINRKLANNPLTCICSKSFSGEHSTHQ